MIKAKVERKICDRPHAWAVFETEMGMVTKCSYCRTLWTDWAWDEIQLLSTSTIIYLPEGGVPMGDLLQIHVLERKEKQREGREVYLGLFPDSSVIRKGDEVRADELEPDDIIWWDEQPLKVVWVRPWPGGDDEK